MADEPAAVDAVTEAAPEAPEAPAAPPAAPPASDETLQRVLDRVEELGTQVSDFGSRLPQEQAQAEPDDLEQFLSQLGYENPPEPEEEPDEQQDLDIRQLLGTIQDLARKTAKEEITPHITAQTERETERAFEELESRYPQLQEEEWVNKVADTVQSLAQSMGNESLVNSPQFAELVFKSLVADEHAAQETPVTASQEGLERPRGSNPGRSEPEQDDAQAIVDAGTSNKLADLFGAKK